MKFLLVLLFAGVYAQNRCPTGTGFFPDPDQCDLYYICSKGKHEERLCPDGLVFDDRDPNFERCEVPANVDCGDRTALQEAKPSAGCPRANGFYPHPRDCTKFHNCFEGKPKEFHCPAGLVYDEVSSTCVWAASSRRPECLKPKRDPLEDGFECPGEAQGLTEADGRKVPHPTYPHPTDCQKFYICRNGLDPQLGSCSPGSVYNDVSYRCEDPANVQGCENYYSGNSKPAGQPAGIPSRKNK
ncbi:unnamed protein product [Phyllotreta striolata]|uniref:Chitin-binding type-2 domain-containing protein n=1 Tax=Phyllotreta striolata TaxID=444603 RepID=A0A9N9XUU8_PHYSR|nr:unnamed protein product [Phyllotreta striolata]